MWAKRIIEGFEVAPFEVAELTQNMIDKGYVEHTYVVVEPLILTAQEIAENNFNAKLAIDTLFPYFINELGAIRGDVALIMNMISYGGAFFAIAKSIDDMFNEGKISQAGYQYFLQVFLEQDIDLLKYIE